MWLQQMCNLLLDGFIFMCSTFRCHCDILYFRCLFDISFSHFNLLIATIWIMFGDHFIGLFHNPSLRLDFNSMSDIEFWVACYGHDPDLHAEFSGCLFACMPSSTCGVRTTGCDPSDFDGYASYQTTTWCNN